MRSLIEALIGSACGATAGSGLLEIASRAAIEREARRSANYQRFLGEEAARLKALYEEGMGAQRFKWAEEFATATATVTTMPWVTDHHPTVVVKDISIPKADIDLSPGSYRPVELERHEDFAARLAARGPNPWDHHTENSKK